jgi:Lamin Tail Domain/Secretion system C-terminal sorting domain
MKRFFFLLYAVILSSSSYAQLRMNEVCYDPSNVGLEGDANNDGVYDQVEDEFIEFVNTGTTPLDVSKYKIYDYVIASRVKTLRHTMAVGLTIPARGALVVFGGGTAVGSFGGAVVVIDQGTAGLSLGNTGEKVFLEDSSGNVLDSLDTDALSNNPNESYTRNPDFTGDYVQHGTIQVGRLFSPGLKVDLTPFDGTISTKHNLIGSNRYVYPNPSKGKVTLGGALIGKKINIYNTSAKEVLSVKVSAKEVDLSSLPDGLYIMKISDGFGSEVVKVLLTR